MKNVTHWYIWSKAVACASRYCRIHILNHRTITSNITVRGLRLPVMSVWPSLAKSICNWVTAPSGNKILRSLKPPIASTPQQNLAHKSLHVQPNLHLWRPVLPQRLWQILLLHPLLQHRSVQPRSVQHRLAQHLSISSLHKRRGWPIYSPPVKPKPPIASAPKTLRPASKLWSIKGLSAVVSRVTFNPIS